MGFEPTTLCSLDRVLCQLSHRHGPNSLYKYKARQGKSSQPDKQVNSNSALRRSTCTCTCMYIYTKYYTMCLHMCIICVLFDTILFLLPDFSVLHLSHGAIIIGRVCPFMIDEHFCCRYMYSAAQRQLNKRTSATRLRNACDTRATRVYTRLYRRRPLTNRPRIRVHACLTRATRVRLLSCR